MQLLNHHKWVVVPYTFRTWRCSECGAERYWDKILQRMVYVKHGKQWYHAPDCKTLMHCVK